MNWKGYGRKRLLRNLRYYSGICLEGLRENYENFNEDRRFPVDLNPVLPGFEAGVPTNRRDDRSQLYFVRDMYGAHANKCKARNRPV
jgi:hypothetical protein